MKHVLQGFFDGYLQKSAVVNLVSQNPSVPSTYGEV